MTFAKAWISLFMLLCVVVAGWFLVEAFLNNLKLFILLILTFITVLSAAYILGDSNE